MSVVRVERYHKWEKSWDSNIAGKTLQSNWQTSGAEITYIYSKHYTYFSHEFPILWKDRRLPRVLNFGDGASGLRCWRTAIMSAGATSETELRAHRRIHPTIHMLSILIKYLRSNSNSVQDQFNIVKKRRRQAELEQEKHRHLQEIFRWSNTKKLPSLLFPLAHSHSNLLLSRFFSVEINILNCKQLNVPGGTEAMATFWCWLTSLSNQEPPMFESTWIMIYTSQTDCTTLTQKGSNRLEYFNWSRVGPVGRLEAGWSVVVTGHWWSVSVMIR